MIPTNGEFGLSIFGLIMRFIPVVFGFQVFFSFIFTRCFSEWDDDSEWFPKQKVEYARRKLLGYNPAKITQ